MRRAKWSAACSSTTTQAGLASCRGRLSAVSRGATRRRSRGRRKLPPRGSAMLNRSEQTAAQRLADFAVALRYEDIPASVVHRAKQCLTDAVACAVFGRRFPWSQMVLAEAL